MVLILNAIETCAEILIYRASEGVGEGATLYILAPADLRG